MYNENYYSNIRIATYCNLMSSNIIEAVVFSTASKADSIHSSLKTFSSKLWCEDLSHVCDAITLIE